ncbi:MAG TPA: hypothetical protein PLD46_00525 [Hyphomicrobium sp.]|nr:hypothetical protein [Hyphomicrobium sp.]
MERKSCGTNNCGIAPSDVVVSMASSTDKDWWISLGRAQFVAGKL